MDEAQDEGQDQHVDGNASHVDDFLVYDGRATKQNEKRP